MDAKHEDQAELDSLLQRWRQRVRGRDPAHMGDVVSQLISRRGYLQSLSDRELLEAWRQVAGEMLARDSRPGKVKAGLLEVFVANSVVLQELSFRKADLLRALVEQLPQFKIRDLKFRLGSLS